MIRLALAQINVTVGDLAGNRQKILDHIHRARDLGAHIVVFPELAIPGYPPEDLLFKPRFIQSNLDVLNELIQATQGVAAIFGFVDRHDDIYNAAAIACDGRLIDVYHKTYLPNYGVFDEDRYFQSGKTAGVYRLNGVSFGVTICEDIWYPGGPARQQALAGDAEVLINISSSPFHDGKELLREQMIATRATDNSAVLAFCNLVGGQDELIFDGGSLIVDQKAALLRDLPGLRKIFWWPMLTLRPFFATGCTIRVGARKSAMFLPRLLLICPICNPNPHVFLRLRRPIFRVQMSV